MIALPFAANPLDRYAQIAHLDAPVLLDSGGSGETGRWDILAAQPEAARGLHLASDASAGEIEAALAGLRVAAAAQAAVTGDATAAQLPFTAGYIGALSYELGRRLQGLPPRPGRLPLAVINYYPWAIVQDRGRRRAWLAGDYPPALARDLLDGRGAHQGNAPAPFALSSRFRGAWDEAAYDAVFQRVKSYISAGDCYQINIGQPFTARFRGDLLGAYAMLRDIARAPFSAYFPLGAGDHLLCLSPERFLTVDAGRVETRPIKGTRPRGSDPRRDAEQATALLTSPKERAENLMIVDLLRNDIGRYCRAGSVRAEELFRLESYATVHHLVSVVSGELGPGYSPLDLLLGCLPGGSITGAPKYRSMQIIDELEPGPRQAWCGSIFYLSRHGRLDSNITIRTLYSEGERLTCWAGGGLVDDSQAAAEYQEQRDKVGAFLAALDATA